jgi:hypothetical protein
MSLQNPASIWIVASKSGSRDREYTGWYPERKMEILD